MEGGKSSKSFWKHALLINPYYFALLLFGLFSMHFYHLLSLGHEWTFSPVYFLVYALAESTIEVFVLMFVGNLIRTYLPKLFYYTFISLCFLAFILHYVDFILVRFMDISVVYGFKWVLGETFDNFIELLHLTGVSIDKWVGMLLGVVLVIPAVAILLYRMTAKLSKVKLVKLTQKGVIKTLCLMPLTLAALDLTMTPLVNHEEYQVYERVLPWKSTVLSQDVITVTLNGRIKPLEDEKVLLKQVHTFPVQVEEKPNIYLFVVESLREDFMNEETANHITTFRNENLSFGKAYSNANCTQKSWYSIFHGKYPFHWAESKKNGKTGSIPLQLLKKMGYEIHVYSAAQLRYYGMDNVMFGENHYLADGYHVYPHYAPVQAWESDLKAIETFEKDLDQKWAKEGNVFVFFIESTHFNYSWPEDYPTHFTPISEEKTHLRVSNSLDNIELIKNRYRNSIHFMDSLFGRVVDKLKSKNLYDPSIILFTGDHGEEFFEEGQLFHASHLSSMQTEPPIYMKLGDNARAKDLTTTTMIFSQVDLFPTVLDYLIGKQPFEIFDGESVFKESRKPYAISARFNGPRTPEEFMITDRETKAIFRLHRSTTLEVRSYKQSGGAPIPTTAQEIQRRYAPILDSLTQ